VSMSPNRAATTRPLHALRLREDGIVAGVRDARPGDAIARRLRELGFVPGEPVRVLARGPLGGEPILVQIGFTRFALRRREADRIDVLVAGA
jgi:ferrous iron transport protein A